MVKLIVFGAAGRMGSTILELADRDKSFKIAGALESKNHPSIGRKILDGRVLIGSDQTSLRDSGQVAIDFTTPSATLAHLEILFDWKKAAAVIGTTGFSDKEKSWIKDFTRKMPIVMSPNMSRGVNLMFRLARDSAGKLSDFDVEIVEAHHNQKKDATSGTAMELAGEIARERGLSEKTDFVYGRRGSTGVRAGKEIGIHALRAGDIVGEHMVIFAAGGERLEIKHVATSREAFAEGALHAAKWVHGKKPGLYSMQDVLGG